MSDLDKAPTAEEQARDLLKQMDIEHWVSSGDLVPLANLIEEVDKLRGFLRECVPYLPPDCSWSYDEPVGWLNDRVEMALRKGRPIR